MIPGAKMIHKPTKVDRIQRYSFSWTILLALLLVGLAPMGLYSWKIITTANEQVETSLRRQTLGVIAPAMAQIDEHVTGAFRQINDTAGFLELYFSTLPPDEDLTLHAETLLENGFLDRSLSREVVYLSLSFPDMDASLDANRSKVFGLDQLNAIKGQDGQALEIVRAKLERGETFFSSPRNMPFRNSGRSHVPFMVVGRPVYQPTGSAEKGPVVATLVAVVNLEQITRVLEDVVKYGGGNAFVIDGQANYFADDTPSHLKLRSMSLTDPMLEPFANNKQGIVNRKVEVDGISYLVTSTELEALASWRMFHVVETEPFLGMVTAFRNLSLRWIAVTTVLVLIVAWLFARRVTSPIKDLTTSALAIAGGDFSRKAPIYSRDEVGQMAHTFNIMSGDIQNMLEELQVAARTNHQLFVDSIRAIANALDAKDPYTRGHSERVSIFSKAIAVELGITGDELAKVEIAGLLHDIGKIGIQDRILLKPAKLTDAEFRIMKTHPEKTGYILGDIDALKDIVPGAKYHHERWNGTGYPDGLKGEDIPVIARIVAIADTIDAMTTDRPYQKAFTFEAAANRVNELSGPAFDPTVVEAFNRALKKGVLELEAERYKRQQVKAMQNA